MLRFNISVFLPSIFSGDVKRYALKVFLMLFGKMEMANGIIRPLLLLLFLHRVSSHHHLYHCQNMEPRYSSSKSREPVSEDRIILCTYLETAIRRATAGSVC